jgi:hypothetical protein
MRQDFAAPNKLREFDMADNKAAIFNKGHHEIEKTKIEKFKTVLEFLTGVEWMFKSAEESSSKIANFRPIVNTVGKQIAIYTALTNLGLVKITKELSNYKPIMYSLEELEYWEKRNKGIALEMENEVKQQGESADPGVLARMKQTNSKR